MSKSLPTGSLDLGAGAGTGAGRLDKARVGPLGAWPHSLSPFQITGEGRPLSQWGLPKARAVLSRGPSEQHPRGGGGAGGGSL